MLSVFSLLHIFSFINCGVFNLKSNLYKSVRVTFIASLQCSSQIFYIFLIFLSRLCLSTKKGLRNVKKQREYLANQSRMFNDSYFCFILISCSIHVVFLFQPTFLSASLFSFCVTRVFVFPFSPFFKAYQS